MKASLLCGAHYEGASAHLQRPPVAPALCDRQVAQHSFDHFLSYAAMADELGFDWVSVSEHHYSPLILTGSVSPLAGALTQIVRRPRIALLGPLAPMNNPVRTAEEIAILDQLSHGRLIVLPLRGTPAEFNCYVPVDASQTQRMTQEATLLIQKALSEPHPFAWNGEYFQFPNVAVWPRTIQEPYPPMYSSGNSLPSAMFAAQQRLGMCMSFHRPEVVADTVAHYLAEANRVGWEPTPEHIVYRGFALVADTAERAEELEARFLPPPLRFLTMGPSPTPVDGSVRTEPAAVATGRLLFAGTPEMVFERIRAFGEVTGVGVVDLVVSAGQIPPADVERSIQLFGQEVVPRLHELGASAAGTRSASW